MSNRRRSDYSALEMMRQKTAMGADIVGHIDARYGVYVGVDPKVSLKIEKIDLITKYGLAPKGYGALLKLSRDHENETRKALFATVGCDIFTKLAFIQGLREIVRSGTKITTE